MVNTGLISRKAKELLTWKEMAVLGVVRSEVVGCVGVALDQHHCLGDLARAAELQDAEVLGVLVRKLDPACVLRIDPEQGRNEAAAQVLDLVHRNHPVLHESALAANLKSEHHTELRNVAAREHVAIAFSPVSVPRPVKLFPVYPHHGSDLEQMAHGRGGVGFLDAGGHGVPAPLLGLDGDGECVALKVNGSKCLRRWAAVVVPLLPFLALLFH